MTNLLAVAITQFGLNTIGQDKTVVSILPKTNVILAILIVC